MTWVLSRKRLRYKYRSRTRTVTAVLEESYVRDDIACGIRGCPNCTGPLAPPAQVPLVEAPSAQHPLVIPDGRALQQYQELWELPDIANLIITTTAVKQFSLRAGLRQTARLRALYRDRRRHVHLFDDLHCAWTQGSHADHQLKIVARFYCDHLLSSVNRTHTQPYVVIVSDTLAGYNSPELLAAHLLQGPSGPLSITHGSYTVMSPTEYFARYHTDNTTVQDLADSILQARLAKLGAQSSVQPAASDTAAAGVLSPRTKVGDWSDRPFLAAHEIEEGLESGELLRGVVHFSTRGRREEAVVQVGAGGTELGTLIRLSGRQAMGRVMHGDHVAVRLLDTAPEPAPSHGSSTGQRSTGTDTDPSTTQDAVPQEVVGALESGQAVGMLSAEPEGQATDPTTVNTLSMLHGEVVGVMTRDQRPLVASLAPGDAQALRSMAANEQTANRREAVLVIPYDRRFPLIRVRTRTAFRLLGQRLLIQIDDWLQGSKYPEGHLVKVLGPVNDLKVESDAVLIQAGIEYQPFCDAALAELPQVPDGDPYAWRPSTEERSTRRDLTGQEYYVCSIDPVGCTDVDDALHVRFLGSQDRVEVGVHIADVSYFVRAKSVLDMEAADRCTSVYLVDRRLDMLPGLLSEHLCSLRGGVERYAVSVIWTLERVTGPSGTQHVLRDVWFGRTIIKSRHQLHYQQAQDILDGTSPASGDELPAADLQTLKPALQLLKSYTDQLKAKRVADGALELESAELRFKIDSEDGSPTGVVSKASIPMMSVIAEMMIAANSAVARRIADTYPGAALLRCHPPPRQQAFEQIQALTEDAAKGTVGVDLSSNKSFASALSDVCARMSRKDAAAAQLVRGLATRAMSEAQYFSTGSAPPGTPAASHYGLALDYYTHFTSPIRRYADVIVHRQLLAALACVGTDTGSAQQHAPPIPHPQLVAAANRMNEQHRNAKRASQLCTELYLLLLLHKHPHVESALVVAVKDDGWVDLFLPAYQTQTRMYLRDSKGVVRPILQDGPLTLAQDESADAFAVAERRKLVYEVDSDRSAARVTDPSLSHTQNVLWEARVWGRIWVVLGADSDSAHGPRMSVRPISETHPAVKGRSHTAAIAVKPQPDVEKHQPQTHTTGSRSEQSSTGSQSVPSSSGQAGEAINSPVLVKGDTERTTETPRTTTGILPSCVTGEAEGVHISTSIGDGEVAARTLWQEIALLEAKIASVRLTSERRKRWEQRLEELTQQARQLVIVQR